MALCLYAARLDGGRAIPHAPTHLLGLLPFRGRLIPVVDFNRLTGNLPADEILSTRVIVATIPVEGGEPRLLGIVAQKVNQIVRVAESEVLMADMSLPTASYLGMLVKVEEGLVQLVKPGKLLDASLSEALYMTEPRSTR